MTPYLKGLKHFATIGKRDIVTNPPSTRYDEKNEGDGDSA